MVSLNCAKPSLLLRSSSCSFGSSLKSHTRQTVAPVTVQETRKTCSGKVRLRARLPALAMLPSPASQCPAIMRFAEHSRARTSLKGHHTKKSTIACKAVACRGRRCFRRRRLSAWRFSQTASAHLVNLVNTGRAMQTSVRQSSARAFFGNFGRFAACCLLQMSSAKHMGRLSLHQGLRPKRSHGPGTGLSGARGLRAYGRGAPKRRSTAPCKTLNEYSHIA